MNAALLIAGRELRDKTRLFLTAAAMAVLPFLASVLPTIREKGDPNVVAVLAGMLAFSMTVGVAVVLGSTAIGRELSDGRLSFYFSKPISPVSIWIGKAAAALIAALACFAIIATPAMLYARDAWRITWTVGAESVVRLTLVIAIALFFVMHVASTVVRSRSKLLGLDFALAAGASIAATLILRPLARGIAPELLRVVALAMGAGLLLVFAAAPAWQLSAGRTDRRRSHAALSKALWIGVAAVLLVAAAYVGWVVSASPDDLTDEPHVAQAPATGWIVMSGRAANRRDYQAAFLVDSEGRSERIPPPWWGADLSRDGRTFAWAEPLSTFRPMERELFTRDLTKPGAKPVATGITVHWDDFLLSDDGRRLAVRQGQNLAVYDLPGRRMLTSARAFEPSHRAMFFFVTPDLVRIVRWVPNSEREGVAPELVEVDVAKRTVTQTGAIETVTHAFAVASPDGSRLLFRKSGLLVDARTGATLARYGKIGMSPLITRDGTVVLPSPFGQPAQVAIHRPDGTSSTVALPGMTYAAVRGEIAPGRVAVQAGGNTPPGVFILDTVKGAIERVDAKVRGPLLASSDLDPRPLPIDSGRPLVAYDDEKNLIFWNPMTGERRRIDLSQ